MMARAREVVCELLDPRLVRDSRIREGPGSVRLGRILAGVAVDQVELLGLRVVGLKVRVGDRPGRRGAPVVLDLAEVALAQAEQDRSVELGVAAHEVLLVWLVGIAVLVVPELV